MKNKNFSNFFVNELCTSLFELTQFSGESCRPSTVGSLMSGTMVIEAGFMHANLQMITPTILIMR